MADEQPPKIEFPCADYPIKVMGQANQQFEDFVLEVMERHAPGYDRQRVSKRPSRNGTFVSITVFITATGIDQLEALHQELRSSSWVKMVL